MKEKNRKTEWLFVDVVIPDEAPAGARQLESVNQRFVAGAVFRERASDAEQVLVRRINFRLCGLKAFRGVRLAGENVFVVFHELSFGSDLGHRVFHRYRESRHSEHRFLVAFDHSRLELIPEGAH